MIFASACVRACVLLASLDTKIKLLLSLAQLCELLSP
jgi:hypothetical protein